MHHVSLVVELWVSLLPTDDCFAPPKFLVLISSPENMDAELRGAESFGPSVESFGLSVEPFGLSVDCSGQL